MRLVFLFIVLLNCTDLFASDSLQSKTSNTMQPTKIRWLVTHAPNDYFVKMAKFFKEKVEMRTNNRVQVEILDDSGCLNQNFGDLTKQKSVRALMIKLKKSKFNSPEEEKYLKKLIAHTGSNNFIVELKRYLAMKLLEEGKVDVSQHYTHFLGEVYNSDFLALELPYLFMNYAEVDNFIASNTADKLLTSTIQSKGIRGIAYTFSGGLIDFVTQKNLDMTNFNNWKNLKTKTTATEIKKMTFDFLETKYQVRHKDYKFNSLIAHRPTFLIMKKTITAEEINLPDISYWLSEDENFLNKKVFNNVLQKRASNIAVQETQHSLISTIMLIRENVYNQLNEKDKIIFNEVAIEAANYERQLTIDRYQEAKLKLVKSGFKWVEFPESTKRSFKAKFEPLYQQVYKKYPNLKTLVEEIENTKNNKPKGVAAI